MSTVTIQAGQSLIDVAVRELGSVEALFALAGGNGLGITGELLPGLVLRVDQSWKVSQLKVATPPRQTPLTATTVSDGQNLVDVALQEYGSVEGLFGLVSLNGLGITDCIHAGDVLRLVPALILVPALVRWLRARGLRINTGSRCGQKPPDPIIMNDFDPEDFRPADFL